jgi:hypothetical protein
MAEHASADDFDMTPHLQTWHSFMRMVAYGATGVVTIVALMAIFLL